MTLIALVAVLLVALSRVCSSLIVYLLFEFKRRTYTSSSNGIASSPVEIIEYSRCNGQKSLNFLDFEKLTFSKSSVHFTQ